MSSTRSRALILTALVLGLPVIGIALYLLWAVAHFQ
jgi:multisubunit Na+/H+ antiporter MnhC subunit